MSNEGTIKVVHAVAGLLTVTAKILKPDDTVRDSQTAIVLSDSGHANLYTNSGAITLEAGDSIVPYFDGVSYGNGERYEPIVSTSVDAIQDQTDKLDSMIEEDSGGNLFTTTALQNAPTAEMSETELHDALDSYTAVSGSIKNIEDDTNELQGNQDDWITATGFATVNPDNATIIAIHDLIKVAGTGDVAAIKLAAERLTAARAVYIDNLNVVGTLANTDNANSFKADVSNLDQAISTTESNIRGADGDTLESLSDQLDTVQPATPVNIDHSTESTAYSGSYNETANANIVRNSDPSIQGD